MINEGQLLNEGIFQHIYEMYYYVVFVYNYMKQPISLSKIDKKIMIGIYSNEFILIFYF